MQFVAHLSASIVSKLDLSHGLNPSRVDKLAGRILIYFSLTCFLHNKMVCIKHSLTKRKMHPRQKVIFCEGFGIYLWWHTCIHVEVMPHTHRCCEYKFILGNKISNRCWYMIAIKHTWWRHQMKTFSALLTLCEGNSPVTREFSSQRPVTWSFDVFFDLGLKKKLSKQSRRR